MKVALYARVSTDEQTVSQQLDALRGDCQRHGWTVVEEIDDTISGLTFTRKGLDRLMGLVRRKKIDLVVCHKLDRLGRSLPHLAQMIGEFEANGVALFIPGQGIETRQANPAGRLQMHILMAVADFKRALISERTKLKLRALRAAGTLLLPQRLRGFPGTTLSQKLALTVLGADRTPVANARVELKCDLNNATFKSESSDENTDFDSSITVQTDATGKASVLVHMGNKTGQGTIALTATKDDVTAQGTVPIEVIDEKVSVPPPTNITVTWQGEAIVVRWTDTPDDRTCFIVERQSANSGEWRQIAILPEEATSCVDNKVMSGAVYNYRVTATNESKYGYPAKLPPPPDRLDSFLPFPM